ncbi:MAG: hypothetical protein A2X13_07475 [Bacteroidetes bacterium GWC2_33_15]|nr:MAG: hypothetical protein A2X10_01330 [Bacteroidetes bacterium GWA2_33_15]OFX48627.1 MAG: hypothetical protein A2X13_07475 [Bacteroidetes bacterium GWC2_33_15]OFX64601.1 MAG: hypothetical protein A2X15_05065 [Bacteroidetes bacterium GWB2_32_14]OFX67981.1 MAG: hypothetical protein A2X14_01710 [Bacteroidetes bacterium GWD2_33_33]HAN18215.1 DNA-binding response regulator [Bacteroidales bacterium]
MTSNRYKVLVVDDERLARKELINMLSGYECIESVHEAEDVNSAINMIGKIDPNLIFLDIQMPGDSGFDLLNKIDYKGKVIFATAFDEYALRAFEVNALDYLLKPITHERLKKAIERLESGSAEEPSLEYKLKYDDRLFLTLGTKLVFIKVSSIIAIESEGDYSRINTIEGNSGLVSKSMKEWENRLPLNYFCRIHRSTIINLEYIEKIDNWFNYSYKISLKSIKEPYTISRRYAKILKERFR